MHRPAIRLFQTVFALLLALSPVARADFYLHPWQDFHQSADSALLSVELLYYSTGSNFYPGLGSVTPTGFNQYTRIENDDLIQYGLTERLSLFGRLTWMRAQVSSAPDTTFYPGTAFGLGDQTLGASYRIYGTGPDHLAIDLQLQVDFPAYSNSAASQQLIPYLGDGSIDTTLGAFADLPLLQNARYDVRLAAGAGYTYRSDGFSSAIPWSTEARVFFPRGAGGTVGPSVGLGFNGIQSLQTDGRQLPDNPALGGTTGAGGSFVVNAINPSILNVNADAGYNTDRHLRFAVFGQYSLTGQDSPNGFALGAAFQTRFGPGPRSSDEINEPSPRVRGAERSHHSQIPGAYNLDASVTRANDRFNVVKIDKGSRDGVEVGDIFDLFAPLTSDAPAPSVARAHATQVREDRAVLQVDEYYRDVWVDPGFTARRLSR